VGLKPFELGFLKRGHPRTRRTAVLERAKGIEPSYAAWKKARFNYFNELGYPFRIQPLHGLAPPDVTI
jgi:hypothetical protein